MSPALRLGENLWRLGPLHLPTYVVRGREGTALVEMGVRATAPLAAAGTGVLGIRPEDVAWLVTTHAHADHAGGLTHLDAAFPRARLVMSRATAGRMSQPGALERWESEDLHTGRKALEPEGFAPGCLAPLAAPPPERIYPAEPGDRLDLGGMEMEFLPAGGHAPGGLLAWLPEEGAILASDSAGFLSRGEPGFPLYFVSYTGYMADLKAIRDLNPHLVCPGHQETLAGKAARDYLERLTGFLEEVHGDILARCRAGATVEEAGGELFRLFYRDELAIFPPQVIASCCRLLVRRSLEAAPAS